WQNQGGQSGVPGAGDTAIVPVSGITVTSPTSISIDNLQSNATLALTGGTFTVADAAQNSSINALTLAGGTTFQVTGGKATVSNGGSIAGALTIASGATFSLTGGTLPVNAGSSFSGTG